jgi:hypothetical protein
MYTYVPGITTRSGGAANMMAGRLLPTLTCTPSPPTLTFTPSSPTDTFTPASLRVADPVKTKTRTAITNTHIFLVFLIISLSFLYVLMLFWDKSGTLLI